MDAKGICCGAVPVKRENMAVTVFGDDPTTSKMDGMTQGAEMLFRVYDPETGSECPLDVEFDARMPQMGFFVQNGLSAVRSMQSTGIFGNSNTRNLISVYPNPSPGIFNIRLKNTKGLVEWKVVDTHGLSVRNGNHQNNDFLIDLTSYPKGIYYLKITKGGDVFVKKLVLQ
jgi:hypothetical protein